MHYGAKHVFQNEQAFYIPTVGIDVNSLEKKFLYLKYLENYLGRYLCVNCSAHFSKNSYLLTVTCSECHIIEYDIYLACLKLKTDDDFGTCLNLKSWEWFGYYSLEYEYLNILNYF